MDGFIQKINKQETILKKEAGTSVGGRDVQALNRAEVKDDVIADEIRAQDRFRKSVINRTGSVGVEKFESLNAPYRYDNTDMRAEEEKLAYFQRTPRLKVSEKTKTAWNTSMNAMKNQDAFDIKLTGPVTKQTEGFMKSTRRYTAICAKKKEIADSILTEEAINNLSEDKQNILQDYKDEILKLAPSLETVPVQNDNLSEAIAFNEESVRAYEAYLRLVLQNPVIAVKNAVMDTVHNVTAIPDKTMEADALPYTFDKAVQVRDRYDAINKLRDLAGDPKKLPEDADDIERLMSELCPKTNRVKKRNNAREDKNDLSDYFNIIMLTSKTINIDLKNGLDKAGFTYKPELILPKSAVDGDGTVSRLALKNLRESLKNRASQQKKNIKNLNSKYWGDRSKSVYDSIENDEERVKNNTDKYGIRLGIAKMKAEADKHPEIIYNKEFGDEMINRATQISTLIDDIGLKISKNADALNTDEVKSSKVLSNHMQAQIERDQYKLVLLIERARGYVNAIGHVLLGRKLNSMGSNVIEELSVEKAKTQDGDEWSLVSHKSTLRYHKDTVDRINHISDPYSDENIEMEIPKDNVELARQIKEALIKQDSEARRLISLMSRPGALNKDKNIEDLIKFRSEFYNNYKLLNGKVNDELTGRDVLMSTLSEEDQATITGLLAESDSRSLFVLRYAEQYRATRISEFAKSGNIPEGVVLTKREKQAIRISSGKNDLERTAAYFDKENISLKLELNTLSKKIAALNQKELGNVVQNDIYGVEERDDVSIEGILEKADFSVLQKADLPKKLTDSLKKLEETRKRKREQKRNNNNNNNNNNDNNDNNNNDNNDNNNNDNNDNNNNDDENKDNNGDREIHDEEEHRDERRTVNNGGDGNGDAGGNPNLNEEEERRRREEENQRREEEERRRLQDEENRRREEEERRRLDEENRRREEEERNRPYVPKITDNMSIESIRTGDAVATGEDKTMTGYAKYIAHKLEECLEVSDVTWEQAKPEIIHWLKGRTFKEVKVVNDENGGEKLEVREVTLKDENLEEELERIRQVLVQNGDIVDASQFDDKDKQELDKAYEAQPEIVKGSLNDYFKQALTINNKQDSDKFATLKVTEEGPGNKEVKKQFLKKYASDYKREVQKSYQGPERRAVIAPDTTIPEQDKGYINWVLNEMPAGEITLEQLNAFRKKWQKKLRYDILNGHKPSLITRKKVKAAINAMITSMEMVKEEADSKKLLDDLDNVDLNANIPDHTIENADTMAPNVNQWYGYSCWAASGSVISEYHLKHNLKDNRNTVDQGDFLDPMGITVNPLSEYYIEYEKQHNLEQGISTELDDVKSYVKPHGQVGNLIQMADKMLEKMPNTGVGHMRFAYPRSGEIFAGQKGKARKLKLVKQFFNKVHGLLIENKCPISLLIPGHYRTIIGFKNNNIVVRDSLDNSGPVTSELSVEEFLNLMEGSRDRQRFALELVYLKKLDGEDKAQLEQNYKYEYTEEGKLKYTLKQEFIDSTSPENVIHNLGRSYENVNAKKDTLLDKFTSDVMYVPKNLDNVQNVEDERQKITQRRAQLGLDKNDNDRALERQIKEHEKAQKSLDQKRENEKKVRQIWEKNYKDLKALEEKKEKERKKREKEEQERAQKEKEEFLKKVKREFAIIEPDQIPKQEELESAEEQQFRRDQKHNFKFQKRYSEEERNNLYEKTKLFEEKLKGSGLSEKEKKKEKPTALDLLHVEYEDKVQKIESGANAGDGSGWILTPVDVKTIEKAATDPDAKFTSVLTKNGGSKRELRNKAYEKMKTSNDVSMFNNLSGVLKEYYAQKSIMEFLGQDEALKKLYEEEGSFKQLDANLKKQLDKKTRDPIFRHGISLLIKRQAKDKKGNDMTAILKSYDEYLNQQLIIQTLAPVNETEKSRIRSKYNKGFMKRLFTGEDSADKILASTRVKQRHFAKMMFIMHLGHFTQTTTGDNNKSETKKYTGSIAEALAHGGRVGITLPAGNKNIQNRIYDAWKGKAGDVMYSRFATHEFHRKKVNQPNSRMEEVQLKGKQASFAGYVFGNSSEKPTSYKDNYGMDLSLGGLGKKFNGEDVIDDQGRFGHMYQRVRMGDENTCGGMLIGIENSAPRGAVNIKQNFGGYDGTSSIGELHDENANSFEQSAFYTDKITTGDYVGGRSVDLSGLDAEALAGTLEKFDDFYEKLQDQANAEVQKGTKNSMDRQRQKIKEAKDLLLEINTILSGKTLDAEGLGKLLDKCKIQKQNANKILRGLNRQINVVQDQHDDNDDNSDNNSNDDELLE